MLAASCCIVPLLFVTLGIGGSWMSQLTALEQYQPNFVVVTLAVLRVAFWQVYFKPHQAAESGPESTCEPGSFCAMPA